MKINTTALARKVVIGGRAYPRAFQEPYQCDNGKTGVNSPGWSPSL